MSSVGIGSGGSKMAGLGKRSVSKVGGWFSSLLQRTKEYAVLVRDIKIKI